MRKITLEELRHAPLGTIFCRCDHNGDPSGGIYVWHMCYEDDGDQRSSFGYAVHLVKDGHGSGGWEEENGFDDIPSRFYYRADYNEPEGSECFYVYTPDDLKYIAFAAARAQTLKQKTQAPLKYTLPFSSCTGCKGTEVEYRGLENGKLEFRCVCGKPLGTFDDWPQSE